MTNDESSCTRPQYPRLGRFAMQILLLLNKEYKKPLTKSGGEINYGFTNVKVMTYKSDADEVNHLASETECEVEENKMESSSDVEKHWARWVFFT